jgi:hypothetical protein
MKKLARLAFCLSLLLVAVFGFSHAASACPHATDIKYYKWGFTPGDPSSAYYCDIPIIGPPYQPGVTIFYIQVGEEITDCDGNYSTWGDITSCPDNTVTTHPSCSCSG